MPKTPQDNSVEAREEIAQAVATYLRETEPAKQSLKGFVAHLAKG